MALNDVIQRAQYGAIDDLTQRIHPFAVEVVRRSLLQTLTLQIAAHRNHLHEVEEINDFAHREVITGPMWATW